MTDQFNTVKRRAREQANQNRHTRESNDYQRVVGVLSALGFLVAPDVKPLPSSKLDLSLAIKLGKDVEPRILEVLPAAVLSYPKTFLHVERAPTEFHAVVSALKTNRPGPDYEGITFEKFYEAANRPSKSKKRRIVSQRKTPKTFRLSPDVIALIQKGADREGVSSTVYLEGLVRDAGA